MAFFDRKEEVLDIQITQYGKHLLSKGKFRPAMYAFFDDDVVYDSQYADFEENRVNINDRIKETVRPKTQYVFHGVETDSTKMIELIRTDQVGFDSQLVQQTPEKHYSLYAPLGNSALSEENVPSWNVNLLKGEITGSVQYNTGSFHQNMKLPQINTKPAEYITSVKKESKEESDRNVVFGDFNDQGDSAVSNLNFASPRFEDGTYIAIRDDFFLFEVVEENTDDLSKNFDIEVFVEEEDEDGKKTFTPLSFKPKKELVKNGILLDQDEMEPETNVLLDSSYVEHFFDIYVDGEISKDVLCKLVPTPDKVASFPPNSLDCDIEVGARGNTIDVPGLYDSDVTIEDTEDDC